MRRSDVVDRARLCVGAGAVGGATCLWLSVTSLAASREHLSPWRVSSWGRWDTGHYRSIALDGYEFGPCVDIPNRSPTQHCGNAGWFPGYPYLMRLGRFMGVDTAGRAISLAAMVVAFSLLWFGLLATRPLRQGLPALALAAVFPGSVYYGAIFPLSLACAGMIAALLMVSRKRWLVAGFCGAVAAVVYPSGVLIGLAAITPLVDRDGGSWKARVGAALQVGAPVAGAYLLVLANFQRAVGRWDAWFEIASTYQFQRQAPWITLRERLAMIGDAHTIRTVGVQTALVMTIMVVTAIVAVMQRRELRPWEWSALAVTGALWLVPLTLGGDLSIYRAEALLLPVVAVTSRAHSLVLGTLAVVAAPIAVNMARLFFTYVLI